MPQKKLLKATFTNERILIMKSDATNALYDKSRFGTPLGNGKLQLSLLEALYLIEKSSLIVVDGRNHEIDPDKFIKKAKKGLGHASKPFI